MKLILKDIKKSFDKVPVLKGCNFEFECGKIYGLLGKNGAGKTTLFNIIYSEIDADEGRVSFDTEEGNEKNLDPQEVGMLFAETKLPDFLTGYEFIKFFLDINGTDKTKDARYYLTDMGFSEEDMHKLLKNYSSGMKAKIALLTIILGQQKIILLDEPLTAVDIIMAAQIKKYIRLLKTDHIVILSTHMMDLAKDMCDEIVLLNNGVLKPFDIIQNDDDYDEKIIRALLEDENV